MHRGRFSSECACVCACALFFRASARPGPGFAREDAANLGSTAFKLRTASADRISPGRARLDSSCFGLGRAGIPRVSSSSLRRPLPRPVTASANVSVPRGVRPKVYSGMTIKGEGMGMDDKRTEATREQGRPRPAQAHSTGRETGFALGAAASPTACALSIAIQTLSTVSMTKAHTAAG